MKTAISIPDEVFRKAEYLAKKQGLSRSEFYVQAIRAFITERGENVTELLNDVYDDKQNHVSDSVIERAALQDQPREDW